MDKNTFDKAIEILTLWVIDESISYEECETQLKSADFDSDETDYLMDVVNCQTVTKKGVKQMIIDDLDQSYLLDDEIDGWKESLAIRLGIAYYQDNETSPYEEYLKTESGVYA